MNILKFFTVVMVNVGAWWCGSVTSELIMVIPVTLEPPLNLMTHRSNYEKMVSPGLACNLFLSLETFSVGFPFWGEKSNKLRKKTIVLLLG